LLGFLLAALLRAAALSRLIVLLLLTSPLPAALLSRILLPRLLILLALLLIALALLGILVRIRHLSTSLVLCNPLQLTTNSAITSNEIITKNTGYDLPIPLLPKSIDVAAALLARPQENAE
jgi:hypothetical protein